MQDPETSYKTDDLLARLQAGDEQALSRPGRHLRLEDLPARVPVPAQQGRRGRSDAGRAVQGVSEGRRRSAATRRCRPGSIGSRSTRRCRGCGRRSTSARRPRSGSDVARRRRRRATPPRDEIADWSDLADEQVLRSQLRRRVFRAILALPAIYRAPVMLRDIQGMSTEEASAMLHVKDQTLKSRLHRGRLILRKQLADFAGGLTLHRADLRHVGR